jgi:hypothetical protein
VYRYSSVTVTLYCILCVPCCSGLCTAGYYCVAGSTKGAPTQCGGETWYCPEGASYRSQVGEGHYSTPTNVASKDARVGQSKCPQGKYCKSGVSIECGFAKKVPQSWYVVNETSPPRSVCVCVRVFVNGHMSVAVSGEFFVRALLLLCDAT